MPSDRIPVLIGDFKFLIAPLTQAQRLELAESVKMVAGAEVKDYPALMRKAVRMCLKGVEGIDGTAIQGARGEPLELMAGPDGYLTDEALEIIFSLQESDKLSSACIMLYQKIKELDDLPGVKVDLENVVKSEKKAVALES
ncbi:MAG: hypothetical protein HOO67_02685 [Candidatus Peribacteraceae bacterium]|nr:hypothetical protein [Candidatus Peribacteraceae bacterium]